MSQSIFSRHGKAKLLLALPALDLGSCLRLSARHCLKLLVAFSESREQDLCCKFLPPLNHVGYTMAGDFLFPKVLYAMWAFGIDSPH